MGGKRKANLYKSNTWIKDRYAPDDLGFEILLKNEIELVPFRNTGEYFNSIILVCNKYDAS
jgi:hypothetical protein